MHNDKKEPGFPSSVVVLFALFILVIATWSSGGPAFRFSADSQLPDPLVTGGYPPVWEIRGPFDNFDLRNDSITLSRVTDGDCAVLVPVDIAGSSAGDILRVQADIDIEGNRDLQRRNHYMHLYVLFYKEGKTNGVVSLWKGLPEHRNKPVNRVFRLPPGTEGMNLIMQCSESEDSYILGNLRMEFVSHSQPYNFTLAVLLLSWCVVLCCALWWLMRQVSWKIYLPLGAGDFALGLGVGASKRFFVGLLDPLHTLVVSWIPILQIPTLDAWFKIGHLLFFFAIAVVLFFNHRRLRLSALWLFTCLCLMALATEAWQMHLFGRSGRFSDVIIDVTGVSLAYVVLVLWNRLRKYTGSGHTTSA